MVDLSNSDQKTPLEPEASKEEVFTQKGKNRWLFIILGVFLALLIASIGGYSAFSAYQKAKTRQVLPFEKTAAPTTTFPAVPQIPSGNSAPDGTAAVKSKYDIDTDKDSVPDFVETAIGYDPGQDECFLAACEGYNAGEYQNPKTNVMFILDSSGSMAGVAGASRKIDAAKNALKRYIDQAKPDTTAGLIVYGHKGSNNEKDKAVSCQGIEVLYELQSIDKAKFTAAVDSFQPTGWTPIGNALRLVGRSFGTLHKDNKNIVLLVSDGVETCNTDPLAAARELQNLGLKIQIDVIGFDLEPAAKEQLQKVAEIGGGKYYNAQTSEEFNKVMVDWLKDARGSLSAIHCKQASAVSFIGCVSKRDVSAETHLINLRGSILLSGFGSYNGVTAVKGEDTVEEINKASRRIDNYSRKAKELFRSQSEEAWSEWLINYQKLQQPFE